MAGGLGPSRHFQLTLDGTAQQLTDAVPAGMSGDSFDGDPYCQFIDLSADDGNSNPIYKGSDNLVSAAVHGVRIPTPTTGVPDPPYRISGPVHFSEVWVLGTNTEKLNIEAKMR
jgi:hypothetical protein